MKHLCKILIHTKKFVERVVLLEKNFPIGLEKSLPGPPKNYPLKEVYFTATGKRKERYFVDMADAKEVYKKIYHGLNGDI